jgi:predicted transcriptional regulator YdeE
MPLNEKHKKVKWPELHYVYIEKLGPFMKTASLAWDKLHESVPEIAEQSKVTKYMALYKMEPKRMTYRAGVVTLQKPKKLPRGFKYRKLKGGNYRQFLITGSYAQLPELSGRVWEIVAEEKFKIRKDFAIENYVNDPRITKEGDLITEILIPVF